jgi:hypothetical protein
MVLRTMSELQQRPPTDEDRKAALDRVIDEELMIEYGLELGMVRDDPTTRQALLSAVREVVLRRCREKEADEAFLAKLAELRKAAQIRALPVLP